MTDTSFRLELTAKDLEIERLRKAIELIGIVYAKRNMHLGRPRSSDLECISCVSYIILNDGAYGESLSTKTLMDKIEQLRNKEKPND